MPSRTVSLLLMSIALLCAALSAQEHKKKEVDMRYMSPEKFERATQKDAEGLLQWVEWKQQPCPVCKGTKTTTCQQCFRQDDSTNCMECKGKGEAPCRSCGGLGYWPDPLEQVLCPGCFGEGCFPCLLCATSAKIGKIKIEGGGDHWQTCPACRGDGGIVCQVCDGKRLVESAQLKPSLKDADLKTLLKAKAAVEASMQGVAAFQPEGKMARKWVKQFIALLTPQAGAALPPLKKVGKDLEEVMKKLAGGSQFVVYPELQGKVIEAFVKSVDYYLKHQNHLLDLCIARAEANAKVSEENKGK